ncbi:AIM24 family protein [Aphanothece sacrum]|uniref:Uncharacterized protein n=1 Tax=Aphanothece sacrum FPU1 TaxID=1920663 RepID=A0A401ICE7_APHSA|nr:AIM24 family protein [Aphanothece sacrum]GBF78901.1 hypothetical protein AsFPU1_0292 [Aphanothece sacrum FPU1]GBF83132.1 hypothetical protein AsFPU3_0171 [Aphanothece sacrum FPU3]
MLYEVRCRPAFAALFVTLNPGESITARAGSVISMDGGLTVMIYFQSRKLQGLISYLTSLV